jgi:competence protein CoiA
LKQLAVEVARENGWQAEPEVPGQTPSGEQWKADVLAEKDNVKVAIEIQWSGQTEEETYRRQERYKQSGVRCLWLMRRCSFVPNKETPAVEIVHTPDGDFTAHIRPSDQKNAIPIRDLLNACFQKRFRFGRANVSVRTGIMDCWKCGAETRIISSVDVQFGSHIRSFTVAEFEKYMDLFNAILSSLAPKLEIGTIKSRSSRTQERSYLSNGCFHCDALIGQFYEHDAADGPVISYSAIEISERWWQAITADGSFEFGWGIYEQG